MTSLVLTAPPIPNKYEIIPIHTSDVASYKRCRRYWDWTSPARTNLRKRVQIFGINFPLFFGSGIHYALEMYYNPLIQRDPVEAFQTWWTIQWEGGIVTEDWLDRTYDLNPYRLSDTSHGPEWQVRGLRDLHPNPDTEEFDIHRELGIGMMNFYKEYAPRRDDFRTIAAEATFSIPLGFEAIDTREESPNFGEKLEVHARGKRDAIIQSLETEKYGILENKTASKIGEDYFIKLEKDPQVANYHWASEMEAAMYDLPHKKISFVVYNAMRKAFPRPPTALPSNGTPSLNRQEESTTPKMFSEFIVENGLQAWYEKNQKAQLYYDYLVESGDEQFIQRNEVHLSPYEVGATGRFLKMVAKEMLNEPSIYPNPTGDYLCIRCAFRAPCIAKDDGSDWLQMVRDNYEMNSDR